MALVWDQQRRWLELKPKKVGNLEDLGEEKRVGYFPVFPSSSSLKISLCEFENISCILVLHFWLWLCSRMQHEIVVMGTEAGVRVSGFLLQLCYFLASYLCIPYLSFLTCEMGILVVHISDGCYEA